MQGHDWNDLKHFLALYRAQKLTQASRATRTSETTVARRIRALEEKLGIALFVRSASGLYEPTDAAREILEHAEQIEHAHLAISDVSIQTAQTVTGTVRLSAVPVIVNRILVPNLTQLTAQHPQIRIELVPASDNIDLSKREADLALRFARPKGGGLRTKAQKLGTLAFDVYEPALLPDAQKGRLGWITYGDAVADLPQAQWLDAIVRKSGERGAALRVEDAETAIEAVANGLGKSLLPRVVADHDRRLRACPSETERPRLMRDVWLLGHVDQMPRSSILATKEWLMGLNWV